LLADVSQSLSTDYYLIDELLTDEEKEIRDRVRSFADREVIPVVNDYWERADMEAVYTYEGTNTVQTLIVGREITGPNAFA
jgi:alkylation response protein AidB-like acyl-CoA dehydrogenase